MIRKYLLQASVWWYYNKPEAIMSAITLGAIGLLVVVAIYNFLTSYP